jgi:hypothetical protein
MIRQIPQHLKLCKWIKGGCWNIVDTDLVSALALCINGAILSSVVA